MPTFIDDDPDYTSKHFSNTPMKSDKEYQKIITLLANRCNKAVADVLNDYIKQNKEVLSLDQVTAILTFLYCFAQEDLLSLMPISIRKRLFTMSVNKTCDYLNDVIDKMDFSKPRADPKVRDWRDLK